MVCITVQLLMNILCWHRHNELSLKPSGINRRFLWTIYKAQKLKMKTCLVYFGFHRSVESSIVVSTFVQWSSANSIYFEVMLNVCRWFNDVNWSPAEIPDFPWLINWIMYRIFINQTSKFSNDETFSLHHSICLSSPETESELPSLNLQVS